MEQFRFRGIAHLWKEIASRPGRSFTDRTVLSVNERLVSRLGKKVQTLFSMDGELFTDSVIPMLIASESVSIPEPRRTYRC